MASALLAVARGLADAQESDRALQVIETSIGNAAQAEGGYRAKLLADTAGLLQALGQEDWAGEYHHPSNFLSAYLLFSQET